MHGAHEHIHDNLEPLEKGKIHIGEQEESYIYYGILRDNTLHQYQILIAPFVDLSEVGDVDEQSLRNNTMHIPNDVLSCFIDTKHISGYTADSALKLALVSEISGYFLSYLDEAFEIIEDPESISQESLVATQDILNFLDPVPDESNHSIMKLSEILVQKLIKFHSLSEGDISNIQ